MGLVVLLVWGSRQMAVPYTPGEAIPVSLEPTHLPMYALRTVLRMVAALFLSFVFTFTYATLAAKSRRAEGIMVPLLDILQSVPILGFLSITVTGFIALFPANLLFPVAVFLMVRYRLSPEIWTAPLMILGTQWYILFNVIAGASAIPNDLREAAQNLGLSGWPLWKHLLLPGIIPSLLTGLVTASGILSLENPGRVDEV